MIHDILIQNKHIAASSRLSPQMVELCKDRIMYHFISEYIVTNSCVKIKSHKNNMHKFKGLQKEVKSQLNQFRWNIISDQLQDDKGALKSFWSHIKNLRKDNVGITDLKVESKVISDSKEKAECVSHQFSNVLTNEDTSTVPEMSTSNIREIDLLVISHAGVLKLLQDLSISKAHGPDQISPWGIKMFTKALNPILTDLFQTSVATGKDPT